MIKIIGIEHVGIAVDNLNQDAKIWNEVLNLKHLSTEHVDKQGVITDIYETGKGKIELLLSKYPDSPIAKFIEKRGKGIHHICLQVENLDDAVESLKTNEIPIINNKSSIGAEGYKVIFIHPRYTGGVLLELAEKPA